MKFSFISYDKMKDNIDFTIYRVKNSPKYCDMINLKFFDVSEDSNNLTMTFLKTL